MGLRISNILAADIDNRVLNVHRQARDNPTLVWEFANQLAEECRGDLRWLYDRSSGCGDKTPEDAGMYIINTTVSFGGRVDGSFGYVPGPSDVWLHNLKRKLTMASYLYRHATFKCMTWDETLAKVRHDDFVYLDPPYFGTAADVYGEYGSHMDHEALCDALSKADYHWILSYGDCEPARRLYADYPMREIPHSYSWRKGRDTSTIGRQVIELLISNRPFQTPQQRRLFP